MSELPKRIYNEKNGLHYTLYGDYYLPEIGLTESDQIPLGRWGLMCQRYLQKNHPGRFSRMLLGGTLMDYLHSVDEQAESRYDTLMKGYQKSWNITDEYSGALKAPVRSNGNHRSGVRKSYAA